MMNKKGLSDIVATVLIVLLALAAVAIVWAFLRPMFDTAASSTDLKSKCFSVDVQPISCVYEYDKIDVKFRNMAGDAQFASMVVNGPNGATLTGGSAEKPVGDLLGTVTHKFDFTGVQGFVDFSLGAVSDFVVAGIVTNEEGGRETCPSKSIQCVPLCDAAHCSLCDSESKCSGVAGGACTWASGACTTTTNP